MITIEKVLKSVSVSVLAATLVFTIAVVVMELAKPKDVLERIKGEHCASVSEPAAAPSCEDDLIKAGGECVFVPSDLRGKSPFAASLFKFVRLEGLDYLFAGKSGILLKKNGGQLLDEAAFIFKCLRENQCSLNIQDSRRTITGTALDTEGNVEISVTYENSSISTAAKNMKKLMGEIAKIKKLDLSKLRLVLYFHSEYAYLEDKNDNYLISLPKSGIDGLYLKSRGAKIRLLPWEYTANPLSVLDRKGVQYGLEKDEYKKDAASVYFYRTTQFSENKGDTLPWLMGSTLGKTSYSPLFSLRLTAKHLKNIQREDGSFPTELETTDAKEKNAKESLLMQAYAAEVLFKSAEILEDPALAEAAGKSLEYVLAKEEKDDAALAKMETLFAGHKPDGIHDLRFADFAYAEKAVTSNFIYTGIFIEAFSTISKDKNKDERISELLKSAFAFFDAANTENKMRFIAYLADFTPGKDSVSYKTMKDFFESQSGFLKSRVFDARGFRHESGSFTAGENRNSPDTSLSILLSDGLLKALSNGLVSGETAETVLVSSDFITKLIVSGDDFPNWGSAKAKTMIQGGVRASGRSRSVKLSNTLRAASYFINRIKRERNELF